MIPKRKAWRAHWATPRLLGYYVFWGTTSSEVLRLLRYYAARYFPKKSKIFCQPSTAASGRKAGRFTEKNACPAPS
jgi:hypothetical protein